MYAEYTRCTDILRDIFHNTAVAKQWTAKWPFVANAVFRVVQNHGE